MSQQPDNTSISPASFRDPSGFVFTRLGKLYRQINLRFKEDYDKLLSSGLYRALADDRLLLPHDEVDVQPMISDGCYKVIEPERILMISYPYEWCFSQLKDAALATLRIQQKALEHGMSLKDASAYNIQFHKGKPVLIDTLSFETLKPGKPWVAYRQFCQHFLAPLALMAKKDIRLGTLLRNYIDGLPLDLASRLLPSITRFSFSLAAHIHLHATTQLHFADKSKSHEPRSFSHNAMIGIIRSLERAVSKLSWEPKGTEWGDYYDNTNYDDSAFTRKKETVADLIRKANPSLVWDLGANTGVFSSLSAEMGIPTIAFDIDPAAVEKAYRSCRRGQESNILPLLMDLTNPSPALGWANEERMSILQRGPAGTVLALALIHHLAISNNLPMEKIAAFLSDVGPSLIIEFVPKTDSQVEKLLATREDVFTDYTEEGFLKAFSTCFHILKTVPVPQSGRSIYLMGSKR
jgi:hypothetical protein